MENFQIGDIVEALPNNGYAVTTNGWEGEVIGFKAADAYYSDDEGEYPDQYIAVKSMGDFSNTYGVYAARNGRPNFCLKERKAPPKEYTPVTPLW